MRRQSPDLLAPFTSRNFKTKYDWDFSTEPEHGLGDRRIYLPRGRTLGGSSAMNAMIYIRRNGVDFDGWTDQGAPGWSHREMLPYFIRSEGNERGDSRYHGRSGPLTVRDGRSMHPLVDHLIEAAVGSGYSLSTGSCSLELGAFSLLSASALPLCLMRSAAVAAFCAVISA
jgi:choline dehydrogenase